MPDLPKFTHDCKNCFFLGHYFGHDVYICHKCVGLDGGTILARWGNEGHEYASTDLVLFQKALVNRQHLIGGANMPTMPFQDYIFSAHASAYHKAWMIALSQCAVEESEPKIVPVVIEENVQDTARSMIAKYGKRDAMEAANQYALNNSMGKAPIAEKFWKAVMEAIRVTKVKQS